MQFTNAILCLTALFAATSTLSLSRRGAGAIPFSMCAANPALVVSALSISPFPPSIKVPLTIISTGDLKTTITKGAKIVVDAYLSTMKVASNTYDVCEEAAKSGLACPIMPGLRTLSNTIPLPDNIPPFTSIRVHAVMYNGDGSEVNCLESRVKFAP